MSRVIVIGSINQDLVIQTKRHPKPGETVHGSSLEYFPGGKGANQAVAAARAGAQTKLVGLTGDDAAGRDLRDFLERTGVGLAGAGITKNSPTGTALITVAGGENTVVVMAGANGELRPSAIKAVDINEGDVLLAQFETPASTTLAGFKKAKESGAITILNPSPAKAIPSKLLSLTDYLIINEHEFELIFGELPSNFKDSATIAERMRSSYKGALVLTLGKNGAILVNKDGHYFERGIRVKAVDSTGAGDCFTGYFAAGLAMGQTAAKSLNQANNAASISVTRAGAASSIPTKDELG